MRDTDDGSCILNEEIHYFSDLDAATEFMAGLRWPDGPVCPRCEGRKHSYLRTRRLWKCKTCKKQFSVKVGTIFEGSPIGIDKWLAAIWMLANSKDPVSSYEIHHAIGVTQKTAWSMAHRIRLAMQTGTFKKLPEKVETCRGFILDKARNTHAGKREEKVKRAVSPARSPL